MIRSRALRWALVAALLLSAAVFLTPDADDPPRVRAVGAAMAALCLLFVAGLTIPWRNRLLLRVGCGVVALGYVAYFVGELVLLLRGESQHISVGEPSALMANVALLVIALPMARYAVTGRTRRVRPRVAVPDPTGELADRRWLAALADGGADMSVEADVFFIMYFPSAGNAASAALVARREGHTAETVPPAPPAEAPHVCFVERRLVPEWETIRAARARYESLARELGGRLVGWEATARTKDEGAIGEG